MREGTAADGEDTGIKAMTRILLIRHGRTQWNRQEIFRGRADIPLDDVGLMQAAALADRLALVEFVAVYSSPLQRALVTAEYVGKARCLQPQAVDELTDMCYGAWEGRHHAQVRERDPDLYARWLNEPHLVRPPGGETLAEVRRRATAALDRIALTHPRDTVAVVSHRVVNKVLLCAALGLGDDGFWRVRQDTACLNMLEHEKGHVTVVLLNDTYHLRGLQADVSDF